MAKSKKPAARKRKPAASKTAPEASKATSAAAATGDAVASKAEVVKADAAKAVDAVKDTAASTKGSVTEAAKDTPKKDTAKASSASDAAAAKTQMPKVSSSTEPSKSAKPDPVSDSKPSPKEQPKAQSAAKPAPTPAAPAEQKRRGGFIPLVLGGVIAGGIGYAVSEYDLLGTRGAATTYDAEIATLTEQLGGQADRLATLESVEPPVIPEVDVPDIAPLTAQLTALSAQLEGFEARLTEVEKQPMTEGTSQTAIDAYERELAALQASAAAQRAEIEGLIDNALGVEKATQEAARTANVQAAVSKITAAIGTGQPFADVLAELSDNGVSDVPAALGDVAQDGVVTLSNLQTRFPDTARAALSQARASGEGEEAQSGLGGFLRRQLGARSVVPKEGSDPDAVLSRAEAAVRDGQLDTALTEIDGLPEAAQAAMQDWLDDARARQAAQTAAADLSNSLTAN